MRLTVRITSSASPESRLPRLAPPFDEQPGAGRVAALDLGAVGGRRAGHQRARSPSRPTGTRGCPRSSRAGCRPGSRPSARRGRAPTRRGGSRPRRSSAPSFGRAPVAHRMAQHRQREPVDLEEEDPRACRCDVWPPWRRAMRWITRSVYSSSSFVPVTTCEHDRDGGHHERREQRVPERVDRDELGKRVVGEQQRGARRRAARGRSRARA